MKRWHCLFAAATLVLTAATSQAASVVFTDTKFSLDDYTIIKSVKNQNAVVDTVATGGNPGSALRLRIEGTASDATSSHVFLNNAFFYDPSTAGKINDIGYRLEKNGTVTPGGIGNQGATMVLKQGDTLYSYGVSLPTSEGVFHAGGASGLESSNFQLFTGSPPDAAPHPDFAGGPIQFGFAVGWAGGNSTATILIDNLEVTVSSVPEPSSTWLALAAGLVLIGFQHARSSRMSG